MDIYTTSIRNGFMNEDNMAVLTTTANSWTQELPLHVVYYSWANIDTKVALLEHIEIE